MKLGLLIFLMVCVFTSAMIPRYKRALDADEQALASSSGSVKICASRTPCAWVVYNPTTKNLVQTIGNNYCKCNVGEVCVKNEDDSMANAIVYRCRLPEEGQELFES